MTVKVIAKYSIQIASELFTKVYYSGNSVCEHVNSWRRNDTDLQSIFNVVTVFADVQQICESSAINTHIYNMVLTTTSKLTFLPWSLFDYLSYYLAIL